MDTPMNAILFVEDLLSSVLYYCNVTWKNPRPIDSRLNRANIVLKSRRCTAVISDTVKLMTLAYGDTIRTCYHTLVAHGVDTKGKFRKEATITTISYLKNGYDPVKYLRLCALFSGVTVMFFRDKGVSAGCDMASVTIQLLSYVINLFIYQMKFDPKTDWFLLSLHAQEIKKELMEKVKAGTF